MTETIKALTGFEGYMCPVTASLTMTGIIQSIPQMIKTDKKLQRQGVGKTIPDYLKIDIDTSKLVTSAAFVQSCLGKRRFTPFELKRCEIEAGLLMLWMHDITRRFSCVERNKTAHKLNEVAQGCLVDMSFTIMEALPKLPASQHGWTKKEVNKAYPLSPKGWTGKAIAMLNCGIEP